MRDVKLSSILAVCQDEVQRFQEYRRLWCEAERYSVLTDFPMHLDIELAGVCNLKCEFCFQNGLITQPLGYMEVELFKKIIDEGVSKGLCAIKLQIRGESFLHPKLFDCISYAKSAGVMDIQITTNGTLLDEKCASRILDSGLDGIIFSVDAHHADDYKRQYRVDTYSPVEQAIKDFLELRAKLGKSRPWVRLQDNIHEVDADSIQRTRISIKDKFPEADIFCVNRIHNFRDDADSYPDLHVNYKMLPCSHLMQRLAIFWNGDVTNCCMDYNNRFHLGNVQHQMVQEIWFSERMERFRRMHLAGQRNMMEICKHCHICTTPISSAVTVDDTPRHIAEHV